MVLYVGCIDTLSTVKQLGVSAFEEETEKQPAAKVYVKEDFSVVNRFESKLNEYNKYFVMEDAIFEDCCKQPIVCNECHYWFVFLGNGGGWGYSGHSIEAIRFMADCDVLLGGFGLFGGRGEYVGKIKVCYARLFT
jgi:E3 ubiquitin-protein ligase MYCBP2